MPEPRRADVGGPVRTTQALRQLEEQAQRLAPLLVVAAPRVRDEPRRRDAARALQLGDDRGKARQPRGRGCLRAREERPVAGELLQVQASCGEPLLPVPDGRARYAELACDRRYRRARALTRLGDCERQLHCRSFPRQHVQRVHALAVLARAANSLPDFDLARPVAMQPSQPALDPALRQPERLPPALCATTAREHFFARSLQHLPIGGTVDLRQYVDHVLLGGPGIRSNEPRGRLLCTASIRRRKPRAATRSRGPAASGMRPSASLPYDTGWCSGDGPRCSGITPRSPPGRRAARLDVRRRRRAAGAQRGLARPSRRG